MSHVVSLPVPDLIDISIIDRYKSKIRLYSGSFLIELHYGFFLPQLGLPPFLKMKNGDGQNERRVKSIFIKLVPAQLGFREFECVFLIGQTGFN